MKVLAISNLSKCGYDNIFIDKLQWQKGTDVLVNPCTFVFGLSFRNPLPTTLLLKKLTNTTLSLRMHVRTVVNSAPCIA